ncbi:hypothetical protein MKW94_023775, partial [Papaver nudicaule]|nr:hypothetical protein [Papaver nudicaule]
IASSIAQRFPELAIDQTKKVETRAMTYMAQRPFAFASGANHTFWQRHVYSWLKADLISELDSETEENNSPHTLQESLSQSSESTDGGDEENPVERFEGSKRDEIYPPENTVNSVRDKGKSFEWDTVRQNTLIAMFLVPYLTYYMIKIFFVFLGRFIWTS